MDLNWIIQGAFAISLLGFMWKVSGDLNRKSDILFRRFDEFKKYIDDKLKEDFVSKEMCHIMHDHSKDDFIRLESKVDNGFKDLDVKVTELLRNGKKI